MERGTGQRQPPQGGRWAHPTYLPTHRFVGLGAPSFDSGGLLVGLFGVFHSDGPYGTLR